MKPVIMHLVTTLDMGGAERLALTTIEKNKAHFTGILASLYGTDGDLKRCAQSMDIPCFGLNAKGGRLKSIFALYKALRQHDVSMLHVQAGYLLLFAFPAAKLAGVRLVYTEHALHSIQKYANIRRGIRLFSPFMQGLSCVNEDIRRYFIDILRVPPQRIRTIENGVDTKLFSPQGEKASLPWQETEKLCILGTVARLTEAKDHPNLLQALALLVPKYPQLRLLMVGDGEERVATEQCIKDLKLENYVHITGKTLDIPEYLRAMDIFVISSKREGLPMAILEAMACALPVVSTRVGSIASLDVAGTRLSLVPAENAQALAQALEELINDTQKRASLSTEGRAYILAEKSDISTAAQYLDFYTDGGMAWRS